MPVSSRASLASRSFVIVVAAAGVIGGAFCAPSAPAVSAPPSEASAPAVVSTSSAATPAATTALPEANASASSKPTAPTPSASSSAPAVPRPKVTVPKKQALIDPLHGQPSWVVFLVLGPRTPERDALADAWWEVQRGLSRGFGCHQGQGAPGDEEMYVAAYFKSEKDAKAFAAEASPPAVRIAKLKVYCLD